MGLYTSFAPLRGSVQKVAFACVTGGVRSAVRLQVAAAVAAATERRDDSPEDGQELAAARA